MFAAVLYAFTLVLLLVFRERANVIVQVKGGKADVTLDIFEWESRNTTTIEMIRTIQDQLPDGAYHISTTDIPAEGCFGYSGPKAIPDFSFLRWKEAKVPDFYEFYAWKPPTDFSARKDKLLWVGNGTKDFEPRKNVYDKYSTKPEFEILQIGPETYKSLYDHAEYKYLLDIEGRGWSARLKFLMLTGSVVFIMDRPTGSLEYWHADFEPWVHYVPVKRDASNLSEQFEKVRRMSDKGESIGVACRERALEVFEKSRVYSTLRNKLASAHQSAKSE